jgi:hypothetical protein
LPKVVNKMNCSAANPSSNNKTNFITNQPP